MTARLDRRYRSSPALPSPKESKPLLLPRAAPRCFGADQADLFLCLPQTEYFQRLRPYPRIMLRRWVLAQSLHC